MSGSGLQRHVRAEVLRLGRQILLRQQSPVGRPHRHIEVVEIVVGVVHHAGAMVQALGVGAAGGAIAQQQVAAGHSLQHEGVDDIGKLGAGYLIENLETRRMDFADLAGFIEQIVIPMVRQRNPEARARATRTDYLVYGYCSQRA